MRVWCCADGLKNFIHDGLLRGDSSYNTIFILQLFAVDATEMSFRLAEVCGFTELDVDVIPMKDGCPSLKVTYGARQDAFF